MISRLFLFFASAVFLLFSFLSVVSGSVTLNTSDISLTMASGKVTYPYYSYFFYTDPTVTYFVTLGDLFEVSGTSDDELAVIPGAFFDLSTRNFDWFLTTPVLLPGSQYYTFQYTGTPRNISGAPVSSITLTTRLFNPANESTAKTFASFKFDVLISQYNFINNGSRLGLEFTVSSSKDGEAQDVQDGKKDVAVRFGDGYMAINTTATILPSNKTVDVELVAPWSNSSSKMTSPQNVWVIYGNFPSGSSVLHDPEVGYGDGPSSGPSLALIIIIIVIIVIIIAVAVGLAAFFVRRRRRIAYAQF